MQHTNLERRHSHQFDQGNPLAQKRILIATILTAIMMVFEILGGWLFNSMALLADGWHMIGLAYFAYRMARHYADDPRFSFGTWKIEILAGYSSAILLMVIALLMGIQSIERLFHPVTIHFNEAIPIAVIGLIVNLICAWLLHESGHEHHHHHLHEHHHDDHHHPHDHHHHDLNQKAAFLHVVADAVTSVLAIIALFAAKYFSWNFLDALLGIIGALLVAKWSWGLMQETGKTLIDAEMGHPVVQEIKEVIAEFPQVEITDLHVWKVGRGKFSCILGLETAMSDLNPDQVKAALAIHEEIVHASVEIHHIE